jgi:O-acetyl-ADP-ribose deacetylase (regulator of RNase III)
LETARTKLVEVAKDAGIGLKQTYAKEAAQLSRKAGRYAHARQFKRMKGAIKRQRTIVGRLQREIERKASTIGLAVQEALGQTIPSYINDDHPERYLDLAVGQTLRVAKEAGIKTMAMPAIGTGVFKFPPELAAEIIVKALLSRAPEYADITLVRICVGDAQMKAVFQAALDMATVGSARN